MELAAKYALVPEEELSKHAPTKKQMTEFDLAMSKILNSSLPDHEKVQQYYELLKRKMDLQEFNVPWLSKKSEKPVEPIKEDLPVKMEPPANQEEDFDSFVLSQVPNPMLKQAKALMNFLKSNSDTIQWDKRGNVSYKGEKLENSNLADLFHSIFCVNKKKNVPAQNEFIQALREIGIPESMIKNKRLLKNATVSISPRRNFVKSKKKPTVYKWEKF